MFPVKLCIDGLRKIAVSWAIHTQTHTHIRGMFKKRPNFLNSAPTSIESMLRLLSAPSVRFWQQTAICPVLLWALVVELHPLNWAGVQTVRRVSEKLTMKVSEEQRVCVKFCCKLGKNFTETVEGTNLKGTVLNMP